MKLLELQRTMARAVMQPLTFTERMQRIAPDGQPMRAYAARFIKPNDRLTSFDRLEIYNRQYWFRVLSSMVEDFPGLRAVLGAARFEAMSKAYITDCPSRHSRFAISARSSNPGCTNTRAGQGRSNPWLSTSSNSNGLKSKPSMAKPGRLCVLKIWQPTQAPIFAFVFSPTFNY